MGLRVQGLVLHLAEGMDMGLHVHLPARKPRSLPLSRDFAACGTICRVGYVLVLKVPAQISGIFALHPGWMAPAFTSIRLHCPSK